MQQIRCTKVIAFEVKKKFEMSRSRSIKTAQGQHTCAFGAITSVRIIFSFAEGEFLSKTKFRDKLDVGQVQLYTMSLCFDVTEDDPRRKKIMYCTVFDISPSQRSLYNHRVVEFAYVSSL